MAALYEDALVYETGSAITDSGALTAYSGKKTGRSPLDKRIVKEPSSENDIWWGPVNKPMSPDVSTFSGHDEISFLHFIPVSLLWPCLLRHPPSVTHATARALHTRLSCMRLEAEGGDAMEPHGARQAAGHSIGEVNARKTGLDAGRTRRIEPSSPFALLVPSRLPSIHSLSPGFVCCGRPCMRRGNDATPHDGTCDAATLLGFFFQRSAPGRRRAWSASAPHDRNSRV